MKVKCTKNAVRFGTEWILVGLLLLGAAWMWKWQLDGREPSWRRAPDYWVMALLFLSAAVIVSQSFRIDADGIVVSYLHIPVRKIFWDQVSQVVIAPYHSGKSKQKALLLVLNNAPDFTQGDTAYHFNRRNYHASYLIVLPNGWMEEIAVTIDRITEKHEHIPAVKIYG